MVITPDSESGNPDSNSGEAANTILLRGRLEVVPARSHKPLTEVRLLLPLLKRIGEEDATLQS